MEKKKENKRKDDEYVYLKHISLPLRRWKPQRRYKAWWLLAADGLPPDSKSVT